ncbi:MAG: hypothetical protein GXO10_00305 [Crenarchaeota archaeon]|nr:hypothetical protein [Thermoproteota archaeon]
MSSSSRRILENIFDFLCREDIREEFLRSILIDIFRDNILKNSKRDNPNTLLERLLNKYGKEFEKDCEIVKIDSLHDSSSVIKSKSLRKFVHENSVEGFIFIVTPGLLREFLIFLSVLRKSELNYRTRIDVVTTYPDVGFVTFLEKLVRYLSKYFRIYFRNTDKDVLDQDIPCSSYLLPEERRGIVSLYNVIREYYRQNLKFVIFIPAVPLYILVNILNTLCKHHDLSYIGYIRFFEKKLILFTYTISAICRH